MSTKLELKNRNITMTGPVAKSEMQFLKATVRDGLSQLTEISVEFLSDKATTKLEDILGQRIIIDVELESGSGRLFSGYCISVEYLGMFMGLHHFAAELRPWLWFLTRSEENRIFQEKTSVEIIKQILGDYGFSGQVEDKLNGTYTTRTYCVQYGETDFAFLARLMEEEGIYYFFDEQLSEEKLVLADSISAHEDLPVNADLEFYKPDGDFRRDGDHIWEWSGQENVRSGKITLNDYDFEAPGADQKKVKQIPKGKHSYKSYEKYRYPGHVRPPTSSDAFARVQMEAEAASHKRFFATGNVRTIYPGGLFNLSLHDIASFNSSYLVTSAVHELQSQELIGHKVEQDEVRRNALSEDPATRKLLEYDAKPDIDSYRCRIEVIPKTEQFRAPAVTPWPRILGLQTAVVTGPSGDEIHTDEYGRIKVQFHWDREGQKDENTTCWVRCVMPWTGKNWGMVSVPRIGNEVVIQFEEGDPDRPICTGMIYNSDNMPPYTLPANMTQTGIKTRSTKQGSTDTFNELVFEDKKDSEFVRLQSEKDYTEIIKNNATITIGMEKMDPGDLTQTVYNTKTETIKMGDHNFTVETGNQTIAIKTDHTETIEGTSTQEITGDTSQTVSEGSYTQTISAGDSTREVSSGDDTHTITSGDMTIDVSAGSIAITAGTEISLTVGGSNITLDSSGVSITGTMVSMEGSASADVDSPSTTVSGSLVTIDGSSTMIN